MKYLSRTPRFLALTMIFVGLTISATHGQQSSPTELKKFASQRAGFQVLLPGAPKYSVAKQGTNPNDVQHQFVAGSSLGVYMVAYQDHPNLDMDDARVAEKVYTTARDAFQRVLSGQRKHYKSVEQNGMKGRETHLLMPKQGGEVRSRMFATKHRWYHVFVMGIPQYVNSPQSKQFLDSFELIDSVSDVALVR